MGSVLAFAVAVIALLGAPLFAILGGSTELAWLTHPNAQQHFLNRIAPNVLDERFADSPILITIPLFTFVGYVMAESKAPDRIVRAASAFFGWMPGGLAMVCILASAFFTTLTGGSGVTIVAIGGLLYPTLRKQGYPDAYALGLVTTGGSLGLLLPPSLPIIVYALVAGIDVNAAFKAGLVPGLLIMVMLGIHAAYVGIKLKLPRSTPTLREMGAALWLLKWELGVPIVILGGLGTRLTSLEESAGLAAAYTVIVEFYVHKDLSLKKDMMRVARASMVLAGAIILILAMANALVNFLTDAEVPRRLLEYMESHGVTERWQFLLALNVFLLIIGMLMEGFSAILVAVPLILEAAAGKGLHPFHLAMMFLLNLELAYCTPPLGLNLFISSFRFDRPLAHLYRVVLPFTAILGLGLLLVIYVEPLSTVLVQMDIREAYAQAEKRQEAPRDAWLLRCVQADRTNPKPCTPEDKLKFGVDGKTNPYLAVAAPSASTAPAAESAKPASDDPMEELKRQMMETGDKKPGATPEDPMEELKRQMMEAGDKKPGATPSASASAAADPMEELKRQMMEAGTKKK